LISISATLAAIPGFLIALIIDICRLPWGSRRITCLWLSVGWLLLGIATFAISLRLLLVFISRSLLLGFLLCRFHLLLVANHFHLMLFSI